MGLFNSKVLLILKPDAVAIRPMGCWILYSIMRRGFIPTHFKFIQKVSLDAIRQHYSDVLKVLTQSQTNFLMHYMTSGPIVIVIFTGKLAQ